MGQRAVIGCLSLKDLKAKAIQTELEQMYENEAREMGR
jgi:hypothetical protein